MAVIIVEQINRSKKLLARDRLNSDTITIGRSYQNDIVIDDPHICPEHLTIEYDGECWRVKDQDSLNGTFLEDSKQSADEHIVHSGDILSIGKSQIRVVFPDHPVAPTIAFSPFESLIDFCRKPATLLVSLIVFALMSGYLVYLSKSTHVNFTQVLVPAIGMTLGFTLWPAIISLISYLTKNEARFWSQVGISFIIFNLFLLNDGLDYLLHFNLSSAWPVYWLSTIIPVALTFCLFWLNCYFGFDMSKKKRNTIAVSMCLLIFGGGYLIEVSNKPEFRSQPYYDATIMTPNFLIAPSSSVDKFVEDANKVFEEADEKREEDNS